MIAVSGVLDAYLDGLSTGAAHDLRELAGPNGQDIYRYWGLLILGRSGRGLIVASDRTDLEVAERQIRVPIALWFSIPTAQLGRMASRIFGGEDASGMWRLGDILLEQGRVREQDIEKALVLQKRSGDRIGEILVAEGAMRPLDLAAAVARQLRLPLLEMNDVHLNADRGGTLLDPAVVRLLDPAFMQTHLVVPVGWAGRSLVLAMVDPSRSDLVEIVSQQVGRPVLPVVTGRRDVLRVLEEAFGPLYSEHSREELAQWRPEDSARRVLSRGQALVFGISALLLAVIAFLWPWQTLIGFNMVSIAFYFSFSMTKFYLTSSSLDHELEIAVTDEELSALDWSTLPTYTVLVPAYREAEVLPTLVAALRRLQYPKPRLDVKLLLEADDTATIEAAKSCGLPPFIDMVILPSEQPKTKPKALNYGLLHSRGQYVVIYDAEDVPEPDQLLKAVVAFRKASPDIGCIQAKLSYFNSTQNLLTRWFTTEYAMWFDLLLPALDKVKWPVPLGGTSNHFRLDIIRGIGAWDPYNVAEDADLGIRLHKSGYRTAMLDSTTWEEANSRLGNWIRQRSRWIKGYMQTWLVHMRHPVRLWREMGTNAFWGFQVMIAGTFWAFLLNPWYWWVTTLWFLTHAGWIPPLFPGWVYFLGMFNLFIGNFVFSYTNMAGAMRRQAFPLVRSAILSPFYWSLMSVAAWKALWQLISRPSYWEKTTHGLSNVSPPSLPPVYSRQWEPESAQSR